MEAVQQVINQVRQEFEAALSKGDGESFVLSGQASLALGRLIRELEIRRQTGNLTVQENHWLKAIDELFENIARYNQKVRLGQLAKTPLSRTPVYDFPKSQLSEEQELSSPFFIPKISEQEANEIIQDLNHQFEEKVLKKLKRRPELERIPPSNPEDYALGAEAVDSGRDLEDYLATVKAERPNLPFMDEDSGRDLSKLTSHL